MDSQELINTLVLRSARGRKPSPLVMVVERELTREDIEALAAEPPAGPALPTAVTPPLQRLRHSHHLLARMLAHGTSHVEAALATGYSGSRISILLKDPSFSELVAYYAAQVKDQYVDVHAKLAAVGMDAVQSLHEDLEEGTLGTKDKLALAQLALDRSGVVVGPKAPAGPAPGVTINLKFVSPPKASPEGDSPVIDVIPTRGEAP